MTQIQQNNLYAPGFATYGLRGKVGEKADDGPGIFLSSYVLSDPVMLSQATQKLRENKILSNAVDILLSRKYIKNDYILDASGKIYYVDEDSNKELTIKSNEHITEITISTDNEHFSSYDPDLGLGLNKIFNKGKYAGVDIVTLRSKLYDSQVPDSYANDPIYQTRDNTQSNIDDIMTPLRVITDLSIKNDRGDTVYPLVSYNVINQVGETPKSLRLFYNTSTQSVHLESTSSILIEAPTVEVRNLDPDDINKFEDYSPVATNIQTTKNSLYNKLISAETVSNKQIYKLSDLYVDIITKYEEVGLNLYPEFILTCIPKSGSNPEVKEIYFPKSQTASSSPISYHINESINNINTFMDLNSSLYGKYYLSILDGTNHSFPIREY